MAFNGDVVPTVRVLTGTGVRTAARDNSGIGERPVKGRPL